MPIWDQTHGLRTGAYRRVGVNELYVRKVDGGWAWYVDGFLMGVERGAAAAQAASEAAIRGMALTHTACLAASA